MRDIAHLRPACMRNPKNHVMRLHSAASACMGGGGTTNHSECLTRAQEAGAVGASRLVFLDSDAAYVFANLLIKQF